MALIGLVRVSSDDQDAARQRAALGPMCSTIFDEPHSRRVRIERRPELRAAIDSMVMGDRLVVTRVQKLGPSVIDGLVVLNALHEQGLEVRVLEGIAVGDPVADPGILDLGHDIARLAPRAPQRSDQSGAT